VTGRGRPSPSSADRDELDRFKRDINLTAFAADRGYRIDRRESSQGSVVMRHPGTDDKIVIARREGDKHWTYFSVRDNADNGTIIDFIQRRTRAPLGDIRRELRSWLGTERPRISPDDYLPNLASPARDRAAVSRLFEAAIPVDNVAYLNERGIRPETLTDPRFRGTFRQDAKGNVLFPHRDPAGLSGFESKNRQWTAFAAGGIKALWTSRLGEEDRRLVIAESAIDALSYHQLDPDLLTRYASTAGTLGRRQLELLTETIAKMPAGSIVVAAFDSDVAGEKLTAEIRAIAGSTTVERHVPPVPKDWNDVLKLKEQDFIRASLARRRGPELGS
jgi:hypothetical protein